MWFILQDIDVVALARKRRCGFFSKETSIWFLWQEDIDVVMWLLWQDDTDMVSLARLHRCDFFGKKTLMW